MRAVVSNVAYTVCLKRTGPLQ